MPTSNENFFEIERRNIMFKPTTTLPDGSALSYDGNPNNVINGNTDGETLLYNSPMATMFSESNGNIWYKKQTPNIWVQIGGSSSGDCYTTVSKTVLAGNEEIFFSLDLSSTKGFEWTIETFYTNRHSIAKVMASYSENVLDHNEFGIIGYLFDMRVSVYEDSGNCIFKVINNESYDIECSVKYYL